MADFIKDVSDTMPSEQRYIVVDEGDVATGDVIRVLQSLGRNADTITIEADSASDLSIRLNTFKTIYPRRQYPSEEVFGWAQYGEKNLTQGNEVDTGMDPIEVGNGVSAVQFALNDVPIESVEVTYTGGTFTILLS
jgi:hypothetical protein